MDKTITKAPKAQVDPSAPPAPAFGAEREIAALRQAVQDMDEISSASFGSVASLARLVLVVMSQPMDEQRQLDVSRALELLVDKAEMSRDDVSSEAERLGVFTGG